MGNNFLVVIKSMLVHFFDIIFLYLLCFNFIEKKQIKNIWLPLWAIIYGFIRGIIYFKTGGYLYRIITTFIMMIVLKIISKKKAYDILILYVLIFLCIVSLQIMWTIVISFTSLDQPYLSLLVQVLSMICIVILYLKVPLYKLYNIVQKEILLKFFIFLMIGIFLIMFSYFNFQYTEAVEYVLYFSTLVLLTAIGLFHTLKSVFFYTSVMPVQLHDVTNLLMGLHISVHSTLEINIIREELNKSLEIIGMDTTVENIKIGKYNENILSFINKKRTRGSTDISLSADIQFYEPNNKMPFSVLL